MNKSLLLAFYKQVAILTLNHTEYGGFAVVTVDKLSSALESVNPEWYADVDND